MLMSVVYVEVLRRSCVSMWAYVVSGLYAEMEILSRNHHAGVLSDRRGQVWQRFDITLGRDCSSAGPTGIVETVNIPNM